METKTIYVPTDNSIIFPNNISLGGKKPHGKLFLKKEKEMVVMTKGEFDEVAKKIWNSSIDYYHQVGSPFKNSGKELVDLDETIKSILK